MIMFSQEFRRVLWILVEVRAKEMLYLCDFVTLVREANGQRGEMSKERLILDYIFVLVSHPIFFYCNPNQAYYWHFGGS